MSFSFKDTGGHMTAEKIRFQIKVLMSGLIIKIIYQYYSRGVIIRDKTIRAPKMKSISEISQSALNTL